MDRQDLFENFPYGHTGIEGRIGILENHLYVPACLPQILLPHGCKLFPVQGDASAIRLMQSDNQPGQGRLSAAGLPHNTQDLAPLHVQTHIIDCIELLLGVFEQRVEYGTLHFEMLIDMLNGENGLRRFFNGIGIHSATPPVS